MAKSTRQTWRGRSIPGLGCTGRGLGISPARTNFPGGDISTRGHPGQYRSTPAFANTGYVHASTLSAAFPSGWQQTAAPINTIPH